MSGRRFFYLVTADTPYRMASESLAGYAHRRLFRRRKRVPTGGVKIIYQHCDILNAAGIEAYPVHLGTFTVDWIDHKCRPLTEKEARDLAGPDDVLVVPERLPAAGAAFACRNRIAFVQNGGLVDKNLGGWRYEDFGFTGLLCCSAWLGDFMANRSDLPRHVAVNGIPLDRFRPAPERRRPKSVLMLKRKPTWQYGRQAVARLAPDLRSAIEVAELENRQTEREMVAAYQAADIFVATGFPEGFALPPLEAMACGCAVIGFTGGGGSEFMSDGETALIAPDGDAAGLAAALDRVLSDHQLREAIRRAGYDRAQGFGMDRMRDGVLAFAAAVSGRG